MRIIAKRTLLGYAAKHAEAAGQLLSWYDFVARAEWLTPGDIKRDFGSADFLADNRVVFNVKGNDYRLVVRVQYNAHIVYIRWFGSHAEYGKINALRV